MKAAMTVLAVLSLAALAACTTAPPVGRKFDPGIDGSADIPAGKAAIYIYAKPDQGGQLFEVNLNGVDKLQLSAGTFQAYFMQPGRNALIFGDQILSMNLQAGQRYYVRLYTTSLYLVLFTVTQFHVAEVLPAEAAKDLLECTVPVRAATSTPEQK